MKKSQSQLGYYFISLSVIAIVTIYVICALTPFGSATSPDSIAYLDIAHNFQQTSQIGITNFSLSDAPENKIILQRAWPPGYPVLLSTVITDQFDTINASYLSALLLFTTGTLTLILLRTGQINWLISILFSTLSLTTLPLVLIYTYAWSETLFIPILLGCIVSAFSYITCIDDPIWKRSLCILSLSLLISFLTITRYIGILTLPLFPLLFILGKRNLTNFIIILSGALLSAVPIGVFLWSNLKLTGHLSGTYRPPSENSIFDNFTYTNDAFFTIIPTSWIGFFIAGAASVAILYLLVARKYSWADKISLEKSYKLFAILCAVPFIYLSGLIAMRSFSQFDQIDVRLIAPAAVPLMIALAMAPSLFLIKKRLLWIAAFISLFVFFSLVARGYDRLTAATISWKNSGNPNLPMRGQLIFNNFTEPTSANFEFFNSIMRPSGKLVTVRPIVMRFITHFETIQMPSQFDNEALSLLDQLPQGSAILLSQSEAILLKKSIETHGWTLNYLYNDGKNIFGQLPFGKAEGNGVSFSKAGAD